MRYLQANSGRRESLPFIRKSFERLNREVRQRRTYSNCTMWATYYRVDRYSTKQKHGPSMQPAMRPQTDSGLAQRPPRMRAEQMKYTPAYPKPSQQNPRKKVSPFRVMPDGREICSNAPSGRKEYKSRTFQMAAWQKNICALQITESCVRHRGFMMAPIFGHAVSRGGGKQDDRIMVNGERLNRALCWACNSLQGSRPLSDFELKS